MTAADIETMRRRAAYARDRANHRSYGPLSDYWHRQADDYDALIAETQVAQTTSSAIRLPCRGSSQ